MGIAKTGPDDAQKVYEAGTVALVGVASAINPALGIAVGIAAALFGPAIERRKDKAGELIALIGQNIDQISSEVLENTTFQDGFVYLFERYIRERNDEKRLILQQILLGYISAPELLDFPLEEMSDLVTRIRMSDVAVLRQALQNEVIKSDGRATSFMLREDPNAVSRLIYFGLLHEDRTKSGPQIREYDDKNFLHVWVSPAGREFAQYLGYTAEPKNFNPSIAGYV